MSIRQAALRSMVAGAFLCSGVASALQDANIEVKPAGAFGGFVSVTSTSGATKGQQVAPTSIKYGNTISYAITVQNLGPNHATGVSLAEPTVPAGAKVTGVSGATCDPDGNGTVYPCLIAADMPNDAPAVTVTVTVTLTALKTAPTTCSVDAPFGDVTLTVITDANTTDTNTSSVPPSSVVISGATVKVQNVADLGITGSVDKDNAKVGDTVTYTATVTNKGPCATAASIDTVPAGTLQLVTGDAACPEDDGSATCVTKVLAVGESVPFSRTYKVAKLPEGLQTTSNPYELDVSSKFFDPKASDNAATFTTLTDTGTGCSTGGSASLLALVAVAGALYFVRRRRVA